MKKVIVGVLAVVLVTSGLMIGCGGVITGSGNLETKQFNFSNFTKVDIGSAFKFEIVQSGSYSVSITTDDNLFEYIRVSKEGETLKIGLKTVSLQWPASLKAVVTMPQISGLDISGASKGTVSGFDSKDNLYAEVSGASSLELVGISTGDIKLNVSGASNVIGDISSGNMNFDVSGASTVQLEGSANNVVARVDGASRFNLGGLTANNGNVSFSGASTGTVNLSGQLDADLRGASKLEYIGKPTMGTINTSDASTLSKK